MTQLAGSWMGQFQSITGRFIIHEREKDDDKEETIG